MTERALIFCDCEGYEKQLFTPAVAQRLAKHDVLVEIHDGVDLTISSHGTEWLYIKARHF